MALQDNRAKERLRNKLKQLLGTEVNTLSEILVENYFEDKNSPYYDPVMEDEWLQDAAEKAITDSHHEIVEIILQYFNKNVQSTSVAFHKACAKQAVEDKAFA